MESIPSISEIGSDDLDQVNGGVLPLIPIAYVGIGLSATVLVAGYAWVAGVNTGYAANKDSN